MMMLYDGHYNEIGYFFIERFYSNVRTILQFLCVCVDEVRTHLLNPLPKVTVIICFKCKRIKN